MGAADLPVTLRRELRSDQVPRSVKRNTPSPHGVRWMLEPFLSSVTVFVVQTSLPVPASRQTSSPEVFAENTCSPAKGRSMCCSGFSSRRLSFPARAPKSPLCPRQVSTSGPVSYSDIAKPGFGEASFAISQSRLSPTRMAHKVASKPRCHSRRAQFAVLGSCLFGPFVVLHRFSPTRFDCQLPGRRHRRSWKGEANSIGQAGVFQRHGQNAE